MKNTFDEKYEIVQKLKPIDDDFFEKLMEDKRVCEESLRVILEDPRLEVIQVIPQGSVKNLQGRSVRLDAFCKLGDGSFGNIEVQKSDNDNHFRRVRYNGSAITVNITDPGEHFQNVPDVCMIFISRFDVMRDGRTIYHVDPVVRETGHILENGYREIYVNTKINDGSEIAELMQCFEQERVNSPKFPQLSHRVNQFKDNEEGVKVMCSLIEEYAKKRTIAESAEARAKGRAEGRAEGRDLVNELNLRLKEEGRTEDLLRSIGDKAYQAQLMKEFGLE